MNKFQAQLVLLGVRGRLSVSLAELQSLCHGLSSESGWWEGLDKHDPFVQGAKFALIHSEVSEAMEGERKNLNDSHLPERKSVEVELADVIIRVLDYGGAYDLDIAGALIEKLKYNQNRADHTIEARESEGGKRF